MENIKQLITDLLSLPGMTQQKLADSLECSQGAVCNFKDGRRGSKVTMELGMRIVALHKKLCKSKICRTRK